MFSCHCQCHTLHGTVECGTELFLLTVAMVQHNTWSCPPNAATEVRISKKERRDAPNMIQRHGSAARRQREARKKKQLHNNTVTTLDKSGEKQQESELELFRHENSQPPQCAGQKRNLASYHLALLTLEDPQGHIPGRLAHDGEDTNSPFRCVYPGRASSSL